MRQRWSNVDDDPKLTSHATEDLEPTASDPSVSRGDDREFDGAANYAIDDYSRRFTDDLTRNITFDGMGREMFTNVHDPAALSEGTRPTSVTEHTPLVRHQVEINVLLVAEPCRGRRPM